MANITAAAVKSLRERTGLPMMECKKALQENGGCEEAAIEWLKKQGAVKMAKRADRETAEGRIATYIDKENNVAAIVELLCESAPVASHEEFIALANGIAEMLAKTGVATPEEVLAQPSPNTDGTLQEEFDALNNRIREVFRVNRMERIEGTCASYVHHNAAAGVLLQVEGDNDEVARDICMHAVAMRPAAFTTDDLDPAEVEKERAILTEAAMKEGKPENIAQKIVEGRMKNYFAENCLTEQPFVKDDSKTVGKAAEDAGLKLVKMIHWELGQ